MRRGCICPIDNDWQDCPACEAAIDREQDRRSAQERGHHHDEW